MRYVIPCTILLVLCACGSSRSQRYAQVSTAYTGMTTEVVELYNNKIITKDQVLKTEPVVRALSKAIDQMESSIRSGNQAGADYYFSIAAELLRTLSIERDKVLKGGG